jgi:hypothetical protein
VVIDDIRRVLEGVRNQGDGFTAKCPAHDDAKNSLKVDPKNEDGWPLMRCYAGCSFEAIREALERKGVKVERKRKDDPVPERAAFRETRYEVKDPEGKLLATKVRRDPGKVMWWELPDGTRGLTSSGLKTEDMVYRIEALRDDPELTVVICEGEKAAAALAKLGVPGAVGTTGGANSSLSAKALEPMRGRVVFLWPDNDAPGRKHMEGIKAKLVGVASAVYTIAWAGAPDKGDAADWTPGKKLVDFGALAEAATTVPAPSWSKPFSEAIKAFLAEVDRRVTGDSSRYTPTGLDDLDGKIGGGFKPGEVYLFGAPTGGGKTTIMQNFALRVAAGDAWRPAKRVFVVSPEMTLEEIGKRAVVQTVGVEFDVWRNEPAAQPFIRGGARIMGLPLVLADKVDITMREVVIESERLAREPEGLGLVIIDYAQQVVDEEDARRPRYLAVGDVIEAAVKIAKTLEIPVLVASQVNVIQERVKGDLQRDYTFRESGKLEHKASVVLIFDRREPFDPEAREDEDPVEAKLICRKNRLGPQFRRIEVLWDKALYRVRPGPWADTAAPLPPVTRRDPDTGLLAAGTPPPDLPPGRSEASIDAERVYREADNS